MEHSIYTPGLKLKSHIWDATGGLHHLGRSDRSENGRVHPGGAGDGLESTHALAWVILVVGWGAA